MEHRRAELARIMQELFVAADDLDCEALEEFLASKLPKYMWPKRVSVLPDLPLNLNGKIDRVALSKLSE